MSNSWAVPSGNTLTPLFEAYTEITALGTFVEMNGEGFRKIVKKYDKTMGTDHLDRSVVVVVHSRFRTRTGCLVFCLFFVFVFVFVRDIHVL